MKFRAFAVGAMSLVLTGAAFAQSSVTFATFADPATSNASPLFVHDRVAKTLIGSWSGTGLTLVAPGLIGSPTVTNATFSTSTLSLTEVVPGVHSVGSGSVVFRDNLNNELFTVNFSGASYIEGIGAGSSEFRGQNVTFSGPQVPGNINGTMFNFSFANQSNTATTTSYTASFTSSAEVVPEPASMVALGAGIAALASRRRRK